MACLNVCTHNAITIVDSIESYNAIIDESSCVNCNLCNRVCPNINNHELREIKYYKQGWAITEIRRKSSSGGVASALILSFIRNGGYVASCLFEEGEFRYVLTNDEAEAYKYAGSKYVKSSPNYIYKDIKELLNKGMKVLFVGLPCHSSAVQNVCNNNENLYTVDLICHGTPSPKILKQFVEEQGVKWEEILDIKFREDSSFGLERDGVRFTPPRVIDSYLRAFLGSLDYTENCYYCKYAVPERVSDITLGDAWGQLSDTRSDGVSLILCQSQKGIELIEKAGLHLEEVDLKKAIESNHQLQHPSEKHSGRNLFFKELKKGKTVRYATIKSMPKESIKQSVKTGWIKAKIINRQC